MFRRAAVLVGAFLIGACAGPKPCTQALCPVRVNGTYRVSGWGNTLSVLQGAPAIPVVSDSTVDVVSGKIDFRIADRIVTAEQGAAFRFWISTSPVLSASVAVSSGSVVVISSATVPGIPPGAASAPAVFGAGSVFNLPIKK